MNDLSRLTLILAVLLFASVGCKWELGKTEEPQTNQNVQTTPETQGSPESAGAEAEFAAPEPLVVDLYKQHDANRGPFREKRRAVVDKYFAKPLADLIWKDKETPDGEMGALDFDPLYDAQDIGIKKFSVGNSMVNGDKATVPVTFENYGSKKNIKYEMIREGDAWKIADIKYQGGFTLLSVFRENAKVEPPKGPSPSGEFEGKYRVGDTTCTVRPDKMAFEIKWAKGTGSEYFYYKDANVFESEEDKSGGRNEFRFDDENYNTGTFVRADGKTFAVKRG